MDYREYFNSFHLLISCHVLFLLQVSIHNISESNFTRNNTSPSPHHVEITTVFGNRGSCPSNAYEQQQPSQGSVSSGASYCDNVHGDYGSGKKEEES